MVLSCERMNLTGMKGVLNWFFGQTMGTGRALDLLATHLGVSSDSAVRLSYDSCVGTFDRLYSRCTSTLSPLRIPRRRRGCGTMCSWRTKFLTVDSSSSVDKHTYKWKLYMKSNRNADVIPCEVA